MLTTDELIDHLQNKHNISINSSQKTNLRNIGYYHGYKGYRFIRTPSNRINFTSFNEVISLNDFDMNLKSLFYSKVMFIETALKGYLIEALLNDCKKDNLDEIFNESLTSYKEQLTGGKSYKEAYAKRMQLKGKINNALIRDYKNNQKVVNHFFDNDRPIPIWAVFESLTLGEFGNLYICSNRNVRLNTSNILNIPTNYDNDGKIIMFIIFTIKDLRNAIAHNNVIFDTRFKTSKINKRLISLLEYETEIKNINFDNIDAYLILITYVLRKAGQSKVECIKLINDFSAIVEQFRNSIPINVCNQILGTQVKSNVSKLLEYIEKS